MIKRLSEDNAETICDLCKKVSRVSDLQLLLDRATLHPKCYKIVVDRLEGFWELLLLPEAEFQEWVNDDNQ